MKKLLLSLAAVALTGTAFGAEVTSIGDVSLDDTLSATVTVTAQCSRGLILTDNTGSILYYNQNINLSEYPIGTILTVNGKVSQYNHGLQLTDAATLTVTTPGDGSYTYPTPTAYTAQMLTEAAAVTDNILATYVTIEGKLSISGSYYNVIVEGTDVQGSVYYPTDQVIGMLEDGKTYKLTGYFTAISGSSTKYFNIIVTGINVSEVGGVESVGIDLNAPVEYYNLQGVRVNNPSKGVYILRQGDKTSKVVVR